MIVMTAAQPYADALLVSSRPVATAMNALANRYEGSGVPVDFITPLYRAIEEVADAGIQDPADVGPIIRKHLEAAGLLA